MKVLLLKNNKIRSFNLPNKVSGNVWITGFDKKGNEKNLINIDSTKEGKWNLISNNEYYIINDSKRVSSVELNIGSIFMVKDFATDDSFFIYCSPDYENNMHYYNVTSELVIGITIGKSPNAKINYSYMHVGDEHAQLKLIANKLYIINNNNYMTYVNNNLVKTSQKLHLGDVIFIMGLKLIIMKFNGAYIIGINTPPGNLKILLKEVDINVPDSSFEEPSEEKDIPLYSDEDYFHRKPRFIYSINDFEVKIDTPPNKSIKQDMPLILTLGPMMTMSLTSLVTGYNTINNVLYGDSSWDKAMPSLVTCGAMLLCFILWPFITNVFNKHLEKTKEKNRQNKYREYINEKKNQIINEKKNQEEILNTNYPSITKCIEIIENKEDRLWERRVDDIDFLSVSLGKGSIPMNLDIKFPDEHFTLEDDILKDEVKQLEKADTDLKNVPIVYSFKENNVSAIIGEEEAYKDIVKNILLQLVTFHSYDNLKFVILTNEENKSNWNDIKILPNCFSNDKSIRYFASNSEEYKEVTYNLEKYLNPEEEKKDENKVYNQLFLIITDSFNSIRNYDFIKNIMDLNEYRGFSLLILNDKISDLPAQCKSFVEVQKDYAEVFKNVANNQKQKFEVENIVFDMNKISRKLANILIEINDNTEGSVPNKLSFLEMFDVGKVEQLNCNGRWQKNVPISNMQTPIGVGENNEIISLDLHEKFHGPHGLVAGMTGSGKSEFIITYILSMAVNYNPNEVQFILIDYKGGGLAGAFENKALGYKLPHIVGTITNLDKNEINRSLSSIESELKRRQALFNKAREISGESTVDIYKYQKMYRHKVVSEPVSHLFIIADEFAELKQQQPEFMEQLISTARIGRSLGVHLILATQKPSGVVDSQIWSNTRFRVCFRVQEKSDSVEVIQCPDAAFLKQTGRFYLQVGYNEIFTLGQSAWAGGKYIPSENIKKTIDTSINFVNDIGYITSSIDTKIEEINTQAKGEELINLVKYMDNCAKEENIVTKPLWLERIPSFILLDDLIKKYNYKKNNFELNPVIGEYDVPNMQKQFLLTIPFYEEGNAILYGMAGSGKENFITSMIYSSMITYVPEEVNYYILDFGSEVLRYFKDSPLVGDIMFVDDSEKIKNLFKMISDTINERKKLFSEYNGNYISYIKESGKTLPNIVVVINNYEAYAESYPEFEENLIMLTRDCSKYGIYFVITCNTPEGIRFKLRQNFNQNFVLQQNSEDDYTAILGNVHKTYPSKITGRGIIKKEDIYEFQTAYVSEVSDISETIKNVGTFQNEHYKIKAKKIPVLPETIIYDQIIGEKKINDKEFIIGLNKADLSIASYDYSKNRVNIISSLDFSNIEPFINPFIEQSLKKNYKTIVINANEFNYTVNSDKITYSDSNFNAIFENIYNYITSLEEKYNQNNFDKNVINDKRLLVFIIGISSFKNKLNADNQAKFEKLFSSSQDLDIVNYIIVDTVDKIKTFEYENWYKSNVNKNEGIWLGNGIDNQFLINISQRTPDMKLELEYNYCFLIVRGRPTLVKYVERIS